MDENEPSFPSIMIGWDAEKQAVHIAFEPTDFKSWSFIKAVLSMAVDVAESQDRLAQVRSMQQQAAMQQQELAIRQKLQRERAVGQKLALG